ncbi:MAG: hypothetical protein ACK4VI_03595 [Alphaproteobacteria bacterium]
MTSQNMVVEFSGVADQRVFKPQSLQEKFENELQRIECKTAVSSKDSFTADYCPFIYPPKKDEPSFQNQLNIPQKIQSSDEATVSRWHEGFHAMHTANTPAAHCSPYNAGNLNLVLSPQSFVQYIVLAERSAMAGAALLGYASDSEAIREAMRKEAATVDDIEAALRANAMNYEVALNRVARECLLRNSNKQMVAREGRPEPEALWLSNYYVWQALREYSACNRFVYDDQLYDAEEPIFVRLSSEDILQVGNILGFNAFGNGSPDSFFSDPPYMMMKAKRWLEALNIQNNVPPEHELPTLRQALDIHYGITPEEFLAYSKSYKGGQEHLPKKAVDTSKVVFANFGTSPSFD